MGHSCCVWYVNGWPAGIQMLAESVSFSLIMLFVGQLGELAWQPPPSARDQSHRLRADQRSGNVHQRSGGAAFNGG